MKGQVQGKTVVLTPEKGESWPFDGVSWQSQETFYYCLMGLLAPIGARDMDGPLANDVIAISFRDAEGLLPDERLAAFTVKAAKALMDPKFPLGMLVYTPGARDALEEAGQTATEFLLRHASGDWGDLGEEDRAENEFSLDKYLRLFSVYNLSTGQKVWIITEADRSVTTILLPSEY